MANFQLDIGNEEILKGRVLIYADLILPGLDNPIVQVGVAAEQHQDLESMMQYFGMKPAAFGHKQPYYVVPFNAKSKEQIVGIDFEWDIMSLGQQSDGIKSHRAILDGARDYFEAYFSQRKRIRDIERMLRLQSNLIFPLIQMRERLKNKLGIFQSPSSRSVVRIKEVLIWGCSLRITNHFGFSIRRPGFKTTFLSKKESLTKESRLTVLWGKPTDGKGW